MTAFALRPPQIPMVDFLRHTPRCALFAGMGIGKSSASLFALDLMRLTGEIGQAPILVVGPMRVARDTWPEEALKWDQFKHLKIVPLSVEPRHRLQRLRSKADIFTISYEMAPWLVEHYMDKWPFRVVIADESDRLKSFRTKQGGQRANALGRIAHQMTRRWVNLTGTPAPNGLKDLWGQTWFLDRGERLGTTYTAFIQRWFKPKWSGHGIEPMPHADKEIHELIKDICLTVDPKDYFDLADPIVTVVPIHLPPKARAIYKELENDMLSELAGAPIEAFNAAALTSKCLQLCNGAVYTDHPNWVQVHDEKIEALRSILAESGGMPLLVAYEFKTDAARILKAFPGAVELRTKEGMEKFKAGDANIGIAHPASMGHGIDGLQLVTNILVRFGHGWNLGQRLQMLERVGPMRQRQANLERPVYVYDLVAQDSLDEVVLESHEHKRTVQDALLRAMKRRQQ